VSVSDYRGGAARIYCCFDRADLRAPVELMVLAPAEWTCLSNTPAEPRTAAQVTEGTSRFEPTPPLTPGITTLCAGPYDVTELHCATESGSALPVRMLTLPSSKSLLTPGRMLEMLCGPLQYYERRLGIGYPYRKCDLLFVPGFPGLAFSAPGLIAMRDRVLRPEPGDHDLYLPLVIAHELTHAWIGGLATIGTADAVEMWLTEALATYLSRMAMAEIADDAALRDSTAAAGLPDQAYCGYAAVISHLEAMIGADAVIGGLSEFLRRHAHTCAPADDLVSCWSEAAGRDLGRAPAPGQRNRSCRGPRDRDPARSRGRPARAERAGGRQHRDGFGGLPGREPCEPDQCSIEPVLTGSMFR
jgi:aminopeptidase N